jgi:hypothetical protein
MRTKRLIKTILFHFLWMFLRHEDVGNIPMCLFSSRRGGSTWIQELICANSRIRYIDQPFSFYSGPPFLHDFIPIYNNSVPLFTSKVEEQMIRYYLSRIFEGNIVHSSQWRFWKMNYLKRTNRILLKITKGKSLIEWISMNFRVDILYLIRHPIPQSLSVIKSGWENDSWVYLNNLDFRSKYLENSGLVDYGKKILNEGGDLEKYVLNWCLENLIPYKAIERHPEWTLISYEECLTNSNEAVKYIADKLNLKNVDAMKRQIRKPSKTAKFTNANLNNIYKKQKIVDWEKQVEKDEISKCFKIIERFGIDFYSNATPFPDKKYLQFCK